MAKASAKKRVGTKSKVAAKTKVGAKSKTKAKTKVKAKIEVDWHSTNPIPRSATLDERVKWHVEHQTKCGCREIPKSILVELKKRGMAAASVKGRNLVKSRRLRRPKFN